MERTAWRVVALLFLFMVLNFADKTALGLAARPIMLELHLSHTQFGLIGMSFFTFFSISSVVLGFAVNRLSARWTLAAMAIAWSLCQFMVLLWATSLGLVVSRVLLGLSDGAAYPLALYVAYKWFPNDRRAFPTSIIAMGGAVGAGVVAPLVTSIMVQWTWQAAFGVLGLCGFVWGILWMLFSHDGPGDRPREDPKGERTCPLPLRLVLTAPTVVGVLVSGFCAYWLLTLSILWLPAYLGDRFGSGLQTVGYILVLPALCQIILVPAVGGFSQHMVQRGFPSRLGRGGVASASVVLAGIMTVLFPTLPGVALPIICMACAFAVGPVIFVLGPVMIAEVTPPSQRGAMLGISNAVFTLAGPLASIAMGVFADHGTTAASGFRTGFVVVGVVVAMAGFLGALLLNPEADQQRAVQFRQGRTWSTAGS